MNRLQRCAATLIAIALSATLTTACSSSSSDEENVSDGDATAGEGTTEYPLTLESPYGETVLEKRPERVAVVGGRSDLDSVLALEVIPVIAPDSAIDWEWAQSAGADQIDAVFTFTADSTPFEEILSADPDVIIAVGHGQLSNDYEQLSQIAPVVAYPDELVDNVVDWRESIQIIGKALDKSEKAQAVIEAYDSALAQARSDHPEFEGLTATCVVDYGADYGINYYSYEGSPSEDLLTSLGFAPHPNAANFSTGASGRTVSTEQLGLLDGDILLISYNGGTEAQEALESEELFQSLDVVNSGGYVVLATDTPSPYAWALSVPSALNSMWALENLVPKLAEAATAVQE